MRCSVFPRGCARPWLCLAAMPPAAARRSAGAAEWPCQWLRRCSDSAAAHHRCCRRAGDSSGSGGGNMDAAGHSMQQSCVDTHHVRVYLQDALAMLLMARPADPLRFLSD